MQGAFLDTSVYIAILRQDHSPLRVEQFTAGSTVWLSAIVLEELYAGAQDRSRAAILELERDFSIDDQIVAPTVNDWIATGNLLARVAAKYGYEQIGRGRLTNDALMTVSASRLGYRIITANARDFRRLAEFCDIHLQILSV
jgi:predicted nucleic acid-binding protein